MTKIKLTKGELKRQRDSLKQYQHYLPTLQLKKQQLQVKILEICRILERTQAERETKLADINRWVGLLADETDIDLSQWVIPTDIKIDTNNIAGANIPVYVDINFRDIDYDLFATPLWVDAAVSRIREFMAFQAEIEVLQKQIRILRRELRVTTQRVNLFEKVKIPECQDNIRKIRIYLGDVQANAVGISKVAKRKLVTLSV